MKFIAVDHVSDARQKKKSRQAFYTPESLVRSMVESLHVPPGATVLEPSGGDGRIVHALIEAGYGVHACEIEPEMFARCEGYGAKMIASDFLSVAPVPTYAAIVMNPPFNRGQDKKHIEHAYRLLAADGQIVAIASWKIRDFLCNCTCDLPGCDHLTFEDLDQDAFKESGASVKTVLMDIRKPGRETVPVESFCNWATANAALTIGSTFELYERAKTARDAVEMKREFCRIIGEYGGSCYGVDWSEVMEYIGGRTKSEATYVAIDPSSPLGLPN